MSLSFQNTGAEQLAKVVNELPRKLLVFLTHHHFDHIDGKDSLETTFSANKSQSTPSLP
jgi:phosphoribosyl 1,2-cyclic phosphodiesterase